MTSSPLPLSAALVLAFLAPRHPADVRSTELELVVRVTDGVATTRLRQTLHNDGAAPAEGVWLLPVAEGAVADGFRMTASGVAMEGDVLGAREARGVYESIVRRRRDPGLLEQYGKGCLRASVFPIPPGGDVEVEVTYREVLSAAGELLAWSFPAGACGPDGRGPERLVLDFALHAERPLGSLLARGGAVDVVRLGAHDAAASMEAAAAAVPAHLEVLFGYADGELGLQLASSRPEGTLEGVFTLFLAPELEAEEAPLPRSVALVLDVSGSMAGQKIEQARRAAHSFLDSLRPEDVFDVIPFATGADPFFGRQVAAGAENLARARARIDALVAKGGTNLDDALTNAAAGVRDEDGRLPVVILVTDGRPTLGARDADGLLARAANATGARFFVMGVGNDVNTRILDSLAERTNGERDYVRPGEAIDARAARLFARIGAPALTDVTLEIEGVEVLDLVPRRMPDLYRGVPVSVSGRYRGAGAARVRLAGVARSGRRVLEHQAAFAPGPTLGLEFLPVLWAERQVGLLLDAIRLNGPDPELVAEVQRLGREYRIVTPYTSHLIVEEGTAADAWFLGSGTYRGPGDSVPPGAPGSPGPRWEPTTGGGGGGSPMIDVDALAARLRDAGLLPKDASDAELRALALELAREMQASAAGLAGLGARESGARSVDDSVALARLMRGAGADDARLVDLFARRVHDKTFVLREGVWTDRVLLAEDAEDLPRRELVLWSEAYFAALRAEPALARYLAAGARVRVRFGSVVVEVVPEA